MQSPWLIFCGCFDLIPVACASTHHTIRHRLLATGGTKQSVHREPSGLAMVDVWWPELGRMHVADGERQDSLSVT